jgi:chromosome segregation ATPase
MQKELNPELFGAGPAGTTRFHEASPPSALRQNQQLEEKMAEMRRQLQFSLDQMAGMAQQVNEFIQISQGRLDRTQGAVKALESQAQMSQAESAQKFTNLHQRLNERKSMDAKMQELIDRHNQVLRSYEVRMSQLQHLVSEKEHQMAQAQALLNEAKMELARLKRL